MKRSEFIEIIGRASFKLDELQYGVCENLNMVSHGNCAALHFMKTFSPTWENGEEGVDGLSCRWLGYKTRKNLETRFTFLAMFEAVVLESKIYKEW